MAIDEEWKPVPTWEGLYEVSNHGRLRSLPRKRLRIHQGKIRPVIYKGRLISTSLKNGYPFANLNDSPRCEAVYVHRLVCEVWNGPPPSAKHEVAHNDGSRTNCRPENLRWATRRENMHDKIEHGTAKQLGRRNVSKLRPRDVPQIRSRLARGELQREIAKDYGVTQSVISRVNTGDRYSAY